MKLAIADPPYLGRGQRWYGGGRGGGPGERGPDNHPDAVDWDQEETHTQLVRSLVDNYDGWAIAASADSLHVYLAAAPAGIRVMVWHKRNAIPSGFRVMNTWEAVVLFTPAGRRARIGGQIATRDVLDSPNPRTGFVGAKPPEWTAWVVDAMGYRVGDSVDDLYPGSGAVGTAVQNVARRIW